MKKCLQKEGLSVAKHRAKLLKLTQKGAKRYANHIRVPERGLEITGNYVQVIL